MKSKILFMGTPEIASVSLRRLIEAGGCVVGVVTGQDKPRGRGHQMMPTAVKTLALANGIPSYEPSTLRDESFLSLLSELAPDIIVVVAYGKILPKAVLDFPPLGCINLHVSLLPKYRGAAPMQRAVMAGERETGVTIMHMAEGLDTGDIILQESFALDERSDFEFVHDTSATVGADLLVRAIEMMEAGCAPRIPQNDAEATYAPKIEKEECHIDFTRSAAALSAAIRGVTPIPMAYAYHDDRTLKLYRPTVVKGRGEPGEVISLSDKGEGAIVVACGEGALSFSGVIPEGKGRMTAGDFVRGRKIQIGDKLL